ncbi:MAG: flagellar biosynthesis protein FlhB, partial [Alphaproteobacteria bacterium]|nr:flagellar biosynthesis protein FlhB [Alphaproteobacteria bacterium]
MADDKDESQKTEDPTDKKLQDAHEKGEVAKSQEVGHWFILFSAAVIIMVSAKSGMAGIRDILANVLGSSYSIPVDGNGLRDFVVETVGKVMKYLLLPVIILNIGALLGAVIQHKPVFSAEKIIPKLSKISPLAGLKKIFSAQNFFEITKSILKIIIVGIVVLLLVWPERNRLGQMITQDVANLANVMYILVLRILGGVVAVMAIIAGLDFMFQKFQFLK